VKLFSLFGERLRINDATEMEIGWVGARNKKFVIKCEPDLEEALDHFDKNANKITLFVGKEKQKSNKRNFFGKFALYCIAL
jgi:hypothetical protein